MFLGQQQQQHLSMLHCSRQLGELAEKVQDESFWASQQPHYGTAAAKRLLQTAAEALPGVSLPSVTVPQLPQLPMVYAPPDCMSKQISTCCHFSALSLSRYKVHCSHGPPIVLAHVFGDM